MSNGVITETDGRQNMRTRTMNNAIIGHQDAFSTPGPLTHSSTDPESEQKEQEQEQRPSCQTTVYPSERNEMVQWCSTEIKDPGVAQIPVRRLLKVLRISLVQNAENEIKQNFIEKEHFVFGSSKSKRGPTMFLTLKGALMYMYWLYAKYRYERAQTLRKYIMEVLHYEESSVAVINQTLRLSRINDINVHVPTLTQVLLKYNKDKGRQPTPRELLNLYRAAVDPSFVLLPEEESQTASTTSSRVPKYTVVDPEENNSECTEK